MVLRWDSLLDNINNVEVTVGWKLDPAWFMGLGEWWG